MTGNFPQPGDMFVDRYEIDSILNQGGFGRVYRATQVELNRPVAIKILQPARRIGFNDDSQAEAKRLEIVAKRFEREAQLVSQLRDRHTVMMYDYGTTEDGLLYMVLEYVDGAPLDQRIEEVGPHDPSRVVKIAKQILSSLQEAHALGMLHRDIKPANIMLYEHVGRRDQVKVLDFGLAKSIDDPKFTADDPDLTDAEVLIGTPRYMSPEQIRGDKMTSATDIYSLGLVVYEMLTGQKAVRAKSTMNTLARHINDVPITLPKELQIDEGLRQIVHQMLDKSLDGRIQTAEEALTLFEAWEEAQKSSSYPGFDISEIADAIPDIEYDYDATALTSVDDLLRQDRGDSSDAYDDIQPVERDRKPIIIAAIFLLVLIMVGVFATGGDDEPELSGNAEATEPPKQHDIPSPDELPPIPDGPDEALEFAEAEDMGADTSIAFALEEADMAAIAAAETAPPDQNEVAEEPKKVKKKVRKKRPPKKKKPSLRTLK